MCKQTCRQARQTANLRDLAPSAKLVFKTLQYSGDLTQKEIAEETRLSPRTVRYALETLEEHDIVSSRVNFQDARQQIYTLTAPFQTEKADQNE